MITEEGILKRISPFQKKRKAMKERPRLSHLQSRETEKRKRSRERLAQLKTM